MDYQISNGVNIRGILSTIKFFLVEDLIIDINGGDQILLLPPLLGGTLGTILYFINFKVWQKLIYWWKSILKELVENLL